MSLSARQGLSRGGLCIHMANMQNICEHIFARGKGFAQIQHLPAKVDSSSLCRKEGGCFWRLLYKKHQKQGSNVWKESLCMKSHGNDVPSQSFFTAFDYSIHANNSLFKEKNRNKKGCNLQPQSVSGVSVKTSLLLALPAIMVLLV